MVKWESDHLFIVKCFIQTHKYTCSSPNTSGHERQKRKLVKNIRPVKIDIAIIICFQNVSITVMKAIGMLVLAISGFIHRRLYRIKFTFSISTNRKIQERIKRISRKKYITSNQMENRNLLIFKNEIQCIEK